MSQVPPEAQVTVGPPSAVTQYDLAFQISPIILQNGIAAGAQGNLLPIINVTGGGTTIDNAFARFIPLPGSTLVAQSIGNYPFANQQVAANATIQQPLSLSLLMIAPVNQPGGYASKLQAFSSLQKALTSHNNSGGSYIVATPAFVYYNLLLVQMTDVTPEDSRQKQIEWQLDFVKPIISLEDATASQNGFMQKVSNGGKFVGPPGWTGNNSASPANLTGVTAALAAFGGVLPTTTTSVGPQR